jgi:hypothetical protein
MLYCATLVLVWTQDMIPEIQPDVGLVMPEKHVEFKDFAEKVHAACGTADLLGLESSPTQDDTALAERAVYELAEGARTPEKINKQLVKKSQQYTTATYREVNGILKEYSHRVVDNAMQIRLLVTNKLILESDNEDAKVRLKALELLGKIEDVGLFNEKSEVTVTHRSSEDLVTSLRSKIKRLMQPVDVDAKEVTVGDTNINIDKEMGLE